MQFYPGFGVCACVAGISQCKDVARHCIENGLQGRARVRTADDGTMRRLPLFGQGSSLRVTWKKKEQHHQQSPNRYDSASIDVHSIKMIKNVSNYSVGALNACISGSNVGRSC